MARASLTFFWCLVSQGVAMRQVSKDVSASRERSKSNSTEGDGIWILIATQGGGRTHGGGSSTYYTIDRGCQDLRNASYPAVCGGMSGNGWTCIPRTLTAQGDAIQRNAPNDHNLCPSYVSCSCTKSDHVGPYKHEMCQELTTVDHALFLEPIAREICPSFNEACEDDCESAWDSDKCKREKCTMDACKNDFPRYEPEFMRPYGEASVGCWGRLRKDGKVGKHVLNLIAAYESLAKCCYKQIDDTTREFKWCSGNELKTSWRPGKWFRGRRVCDGAAGWHSAHHLGPDVSTQAKCEEQLANS